jgi:NADH dehydrogenase FAD-containing subunit
MTTTALNEASPGDGSLPKPPIPASINLNNSKLDDQESYSQKDMEPIETEFLIIGAGPAGAALACFLASYGKSIVHEQFIDTDGGRLEGYHD